MVAAVFLAACGDDGSGSTSDSTTASTSGSTTASTTASTAVPVTVPAGDSLDGTLWTLDIAGLDVPGAEKVLSTIAFAAGSVSGSSGCNGFAGSYTLDGANLAFGPLVSTRKACGPVETAVETAVLERLAKVTGLAVAGETLTLTDSTGATLLTYAAGPDGFVGKWEATGYLKMDKSSFVSVATGSAVTAEFADDGTVSGSSGCNNFTGSYVLDGSKVTIGPLASTRKLCDSPQGVMEQEAGFLAALQSAATWQNDGTTVTFLNAEGQTAVTFIAAA